MTTPDHRLDEFIATNTYRCFDVAYEQTSNELLIVATQRGASLCSTSIYYWTWNGQTLSGPHDYTVGGVGDTLQWIKLAPKPGSNEIAVIASDSANNVYAIHLERRCSRLQYNALATNAPLNTPRGDRCRL